MGHPAMPLTDAEKKRRSRAKKPSKYHDHERETSRKRMAIYRAKNKAQKRAQTLKSLLSEEDKRRIEGHAARQRKRLISDWFRSRDLKFGSKMLNDAMVLKNYITKIEMHKIDLQVAEFAISIMEDGDGDDDVEFDDAIGLGGFCQKLAKEHPKLGFAGGKPKAVDQFHPAFDRSLLSNSEIDNPFKGFAKANSKADPASRDLYAGGTGQAFEFGQYHPAPNLSNHEIQDLIEKVAEDDTQIGSADSEQVGETAKQVHQYQPEFDFSSQSNHEIDNLFQREMPPFVADVDEVPSDSTARSSLLLPLTPPSSCGLLPLPLSNSPSPSQDDESNFKVGKETSTKTIAPGVTNVKVSEGEGDQLASAARNNDALLQMDMACFDVNVNGLGVDAESFGPDAYAW